MLGSVSIVSLVGPAAACLGWVTTSRKWSPQVYGHHLPHHNVRSIQKVGLVESVTADCQLVLLVGFHLDF